MTTARIGGAGHEIVSHDGLARIGGAGHEVVSHDGLARIGGAGHEIVSHDGLARVGMGGFEIVTIPSVNIVTLPANGLVHVGDGTSTPTSPVTVPATGPQVISEAIVEWDLDGDGDYSEALEDITTYVTDISTVAGRDYPSQLHGRASPGRAVVTVDNSGGQFSINSSTSALNTGVNSLRAGRRLRIADGNTAVARPVVLSRDRFFGTGAIGNDELGNTWTLRASGAGSSSETPTRNNGELLMPKDGFGLTKSSIWTLDAGAGDYVAQMTYDNPRGSNVGIVYRFADTDNYGLVQYETTGDIKAFRKVAGSFLAADLDVAIEPGLAPATITIDVSSGTVTVLFNGEQVGTATAAGTTEQNVGLRSLWIGHSHAPTVTDWWVWDKRASTADGPLWGGWIDKVEPVRGKDGSMQARIYAVGTLGIASTKDVDPPDTVGTAVASEGITTGQGVGDVMQKAGLLHPPAVDAISSASITMGAGIIGKAKALTIARAIEDVEQGFLHESRDGDVLFEARDDRSSATVQSGWSDDGSTAFTFESVRVVSRRREQVNEVTSIVAPLQPDFIIASTVTASAAAGVNRPLDSAPNVTGSVTAGMLHLDIFVSTVHTADEFWLIPPGYELLVNRGDELGRVRVYAKVYDSTDDASSIEVYADNGNSGGAWVRSSIAVDQWHGSILDGVWVVTNPTGLPNTNEQTNAQGGDHSFPACLPPWGRSSPTLFIAGLAGAVSSSGGLSVSTPVTGECPDGFHDPVAGSQAGTVDGFDVALQWALRDEITTVLQPTPFTNEFNGFDYLDAFVIAIRGEGDGGIGGAKVTTRDVDAILELGQVVSHPSPGRMYASSASASAANTAILAKHSGDRPMLEVQFTATKSAQYRAQAVARKVGDKIWVDLTGNSGIEAEGAYFIESVAHDISQGLTKWVTTWTLSPA